VRPLAYKRLDRRTQHVRRQILEAKFDEPIAPKLDRFFRDLPSTASRSLRFVLCSPEFASLRLQIQHKRAALSGAFAVEMSVMGSETEFPSRV
jgi:hypothetical protein